MRLPIQGSLYVISCGAFPSGREGQRHRGGCHHQPFLRSYARRAATDLVGGSNRLHQERPIVGRADHTRQSLGGSPLCVALTPAGCCSQDHAGLKFDAIHAHAIQATEPSRLGV
jgi:hypothetical protein